MESSVFTGIVQDKLNISVYETQGNMLSLGIDFPDKLLTGLVTGASVAINGVCLTVCRIEGNRVFFDVIAQTLEVTNLSRLQVNQEVNVERAARFGDEIGGHLLSGHIFCQSRLLKREEDGHKVVLQIANTEQTRAYILDKGYIGLNGCSLTIAEVQTEYFCVHLIPETLAITTFGNLRPDTYINIEIDAQTQAVVETVKRVLAQQNSAPN